MIILDLIFKIHFAPFRNYPERGRPLAAILSAQALTYLIFAFLLIILYHIFNYRLFRMLPPIVDGLLMCACYVILWYVFDKVYVKNSRDAGEIKYPVLYGLLVPILLIGSLFSLIYFGNKFG